MNDQNLQAALEVRFDSDAGCDLTVREYLRRIVEQVWVEEEGFSGKRPFGNSGWQYEVYGALVRAGFIPGVQKEYGGAPDDHRQASAFVLRLIEAMCDRGAP